MVELQAIVDTLSGLDEDSLVQVISSVLQARPEIAPPIVNFSIPDLTYPPAKALVERRSQGVIKSFNANSGFGFIECNELKAVFGNDVFLHSKQLGEYGPGSMVSFAVCLSKDNKPQAYDLQPMGGKGKGAAMMAVGKGEPMISPYDPQVQMFSSMMKGKGWSFKGDGGFKGDDFKGGGGFKGGGFKGKFKGDDESGNKRKWNMNMPGRPDEQQEVGQFAGTIKSFNPRSGYGFIACADLQQQGFTNDVFLHHQQMGDFAVGNEVVFTCYLNSKGQPQAKDLMSVEEYMQKRPRLND
mmetsp:Transcript_29308/g.93496  ORF Transcript_29308/g.93496 Transcript_29308/m.93496 type:complete len:297 (+) Transcript_29308:89-979(+)